MKRIRLILPALAIGLTACPKQEVAKEKTYTPVRVKTLEASNSADASRYSANILPGLRVDLAFKVGGYIGEIAEVQGPNEKKKRPIQEGDQVHRGMVLAKV